MSDVTTSGVPERGGPGVPLAWRMGAWVVAVAAAVWGAWLVGRLGSRTSITAGILLFMVALAALAVAVAGRTYGPSEEGPLDLSVRLGIGVLGGALGGLSAVAVLWLIGVVHIPELLHVSLGLHVDVGRWFLGAWNGAVWGFLLGVAFPLLPGRSAGARGALFSLVPSLWSLFFVFPARGVGVFGWRMGALSFLVVLFINLVWGAVASGCLGWAGATDLAPVDRLPGEA